jgi:hypothetical protein
MVTNILEECAATIFKAEGGASNFSDSWYPPRRLHGIIAHKGTVRIFSAVGNLEAKIFYFDSFRFKFEYVRR